MFAVPPKPKRSHDLRQRELDREKKLIDETKANNIEAVRTLLENGVHIDAGDYNRFLFYKSQNYMTPLQIAAREGFTDLVKLFVEWRSEDEMYNGNYSRYIRSFVTLIVVMHKYEQETSGDMTCG